MNKDKRVWHRLNINNHEIILTVEGSLETLRILGYNFCRCC